jgi:hypothetical protein
MRVPAGTVTVTLMSAKVSFALAMAAILVVEYAG